MPCNENEMRVKKENNKWMDGFSMISMLSHDFWRSFRPVAFQPIKTYPWVNRNRIHFYRVALIANSPKQILDHNKSKKRNKKKHQRDKPAIGIVAKIDKIYKKRSSSWNLSTMKKRKNKHLKVGNAPGDWFIGIAIAQIKKPFGGKSEFMRLNDLFSYRSD